MARTSLTAMVALLATALSVTLPTVTADTFLGGPSSSFVYPRRTSVLTAKDASSSIHGVLLNIRGGATAVDEEEIELESSDDEAEEEDEEEEEEDLDPKLAKSAQGKVSSIKTKMAKTALKAAVASSASSMASKSKKSSKSLLQYIPYIIRACLNPATVIKMTKAYWSTLMDPGCVANTLNAGDSSQNLRNALQQKAKKGGGGSKGKRRFKPGQAKVRSLFRKIVMCFLRRLLRC